MLKLYSQIIESITIISNSNTITKSNTIPPPPPPFKWLTIHLLKILSVIFIYLFNFYYFYKSMPIFFKGALNWSKWQSKYMNNIKKYFK